jgi:hypothetical protein
MSVSSNFGIAGAMRKNPGFCCHSDDDLYLNDFQIGLGKRNDATRGRMNGPGAPLAHTERSAGFFGSVDDR